MILRNFVATLSDDVCDQMIYEYDRLENNELIDESWQLYKVMKDVPDIAKHYSVIAMVDRILLEVFRRRYYDLHFESELTFQMSGHI